MTLDPITVMASRTPEATTQALAAVSSVQQEQINQFMPSRISTIFSGMPGVWFQERGDDQGTAINIRGLQDFGRVAVLIDGARQNFQRTGHNADGLFYFEPELLSSADVVRGPVANIYGSGAIGGVVSMRTKDVDDILRPGQVAGVLTHGELGTNSFRGLGSMFAAARFGPNAEAMIGGTTRKNGDHESGNGTLVRNSAFETHTAISKVTLRPALGHELKLGGTFYETDFRNGTPNNTGTATVYDTWVANKNTNARWRYNRPEDRFFDFDGNVYWTSTESVQKKIQGTNSTISGALNSVRTFKIETTGTDINNTSRFDTGPLRHAVTYGGDWFRDKVDVTDPTGTGDLFTPSGERTVSGAFVQARSNYSTWLETIFAGRYDRYELTGGTTASSGDRVSPKATVGITPVNWFTVYATYAEGYRAPAITEVFVTGAHPLVVFGPGMFATGSNFSFLPNRTLRPEVGKTTEAGVNIRGNGLAVPNDTLRIKANVYQNNVDDFIEQTQIRATAAGQGGIICPVSTPPGAGCIQYQNIEGARLWGTEFEGAYDAGFFFMSAAYTYVHGKNLETGGPLLKIQPQKVVSTVGGRFLDRKITALLRWTWVDAKHLDEIPAGTTAILPTSAYNVIDLYASFNPHQDVQWEIGIDNVFDKNYARYLDVTTTNTTVSPSWSPGRVVKGGVRVFFGDSFYKALTGPMKS